MLMPLDDRGSYPDFSIDTVYVSGASERNTKFPRESVWVVATCEGLLATTVAAASGSPVPVANTAPARLPVVPAMPGCGPVTKDDGDCRDDNAAQ